MSDAFSLDALNATHPIEVPVGSSADARQMFDDISYLKGASVIRMLSRHLGVEVFLQGIAVYLQRHAYGTATTDDLFVALQEVSRVEVSDFMHSWIREAGFPMLSTAPTSIGTGISYCQCRFSEESDGIMSTSGSLKTVWQIPVYYEGGSSLRKNRTVVTSKQGSIANGTYDSEIFLVPSDATFCHVKYSTPGLHALLERHPTLTVDEIIPLLRDLRALVAHGHLPVTDLLNTCCKVGHRDDVFVLAEVNKCLSLLEGAASIDAQLDEALLDLRHSLAAKESGQIAWQHGTVDYQDIEYQRVCLQGLLARNDQDTIRAIEAQYAAWVAGCETDSFSPSFRGAILGHAVAKFGRPAYDKVVASYLADTTIDGKEVCLGALGRVSDPRLARDLLDFVFSEHVALQNVHIAFAALGGGGSMGQAALWEYIRSNWDKVYTRLSKCAVVLNWCLEMGLSGLDDMTVHQDMVEFFADKDTEAFGQSLLVVLDRVKKNAAVKARLRPQLRDWAASRSDKL